MKVNNGEDIHIGIWFKLCRSRSFKGPSWIFSRSDTNVARIYLISGHWSFQSFSLSEQPLPSKCSTQMQCVHRKRPLYPAWYSPGVRFIRSLRWKWRRNVNMTGMALWRHRNNRILTSLYRPRVTQRKPWRSVWIQIGLWLPFDSARQLVAMVYSANEIHFCLGNTVYRLINGWFFLIKKKIMINKKENDVACIIFWNALFRCIRSIWHLVHRHQSKLHHSLC